MWAQAPVRKQGGIATRHLQMRLCVRLRLPLGPPVVFEQVVLDLPMEACTAFNRDIFLVLANRNVISESLADIMVGPHFIPWLKREAV